MNPTPYKTVAKKLSKAGYTIKREPPGSHEIWWNPNTSTTIPVPHHKLIKPGTLRSIIKLMGLTLKQFEDL